MMQRRQQRRPPRFHFAKLAILAVLAVVRHTANLDSCCHAFCTSSFKALKPHDLERSQLAARGKRHLAGTKAYSSIPEHDFSLEEPATTTVTRGDQQRKDTDRNLQERRRFLISCSVVGMAFGSLVQAASANEQQQQPSRRIVRLSSGLQFSDARIGSGEVVQIEKSGTKPDDVSPKDVVLMHLRALRRDGSVLLDTYEEGRPLLFKVGSLREELYYINEGSAVAKGKIPLGVQDAILAQGIASWEGGFGKADPMRTGGVRMVVVPPELAYGTRGVSRYEAGRLGLKSPVARDEVLRYEIELFRCNTGGIALGVDDNDEAPKAKACCLEEKYPCQTPTPAAQNN